jgi:hypothetical protein
METKNQNKGDKEMKTSKKETNPKVQAIEGIVLLGIGSIILFTGVLKYIPEMDRFITNGATIFDLLQVFLRICLVFILVNRYTPIVLLLSQVLKEKINFFNEYKTSLSIFVNSLNLILLVFIYKLLVSPIMGFLMAADMYQQWFLTVANMIFIVAGAVFVYRIWEAIRGTISESAK